MTGDLQTLGSTPTGGDYLLLTDPEWEPEKPDEALPFEAVIGLWPVLENGNVGEFRPNPEYEPRYENSPSDPLDAVIRLTLFGDVEPDQLVAVLRDSLVELALNGDGRPLVVRADDGVLCAMLATSALHQREIVAPDWRRVGLTELVSTLGDGTDVLVNPGSATATRLGADFLRQAAG
ncbi:type VII secretion system-associated protein [Salinispora arenicola]|uniref:type VII secretion system-associated protein n=1 Tax=Salinispora arenicola TaxID=168697 RepID=UPI00036280E6|nr:type VII secretion system-associated protein [Salinispora arenicola]